MTFDEVLDEMNADQEPSEAIRFMERLRDIYAPTVEMTKEQKEYLNSIIREVGEVFEPNEIPVDVKLTDKVVELGSGYILFKYLNAILHPETIKIVDE